MYVSALSAGEYTTTLNEIVDMQGGGRAVHPLSPAWVNFSIVMKCTPESAWPLPLFVYSVVLTAGHQGQVDGDRNMDLHNLHVFVPSPRDQQRVNRVVEAAYIYLQIYSLY